MRSSTRLRRRRSRSRGGYVDFLTVGTLLAVATTAGTFISAPLIVTDLPSHLEQRTVAGQRLLFASVVAASLTCYAIALALGAGAKYRGSPVLDRKVARLVPAFVGIQGGLLVAAVLMVLAYLATDDVSKYMNHWP